MCHTDQENHQGKIMDKDTKRLLIANGSTLTRSIDFRSNESRQTLQEIHALKAAICSMKLRLGHNDKMIEIERTQLDIINKMLA